MFIWIRMLACLALAWTAVSLRAAEPQENLLFKAWAKFKVGTSVKVHQADNEGGFKQSIDSTYTLLSATADKCVVKRESIVHSEETYKDDDD